MENHERMNEAFERLFCGKGEEGDGFLLTGEKTFPVPDSTMSVEEAGVVIQKFFSL